TQVDAEVGVRMSIFGVESDGFAMGRFRLGQLVLHPQGAAKIAVCCDIVPFELDSLAKGRFRLGCLLEVCQGDAEVVVNYGGLWLEGQGDPVITNRLRKRCQFLCKLGCELEINPEIRWILL